MMSKYVSEDNVIDMDRYRPSPGNGPGGGDGGGEGEMERIVRPEERVAGMDTRLSRVETDIRSLRTDMDGKFMWTWGIIITGFVALLGAIARGFGWI